MKILNIMFLVVLLISCKNENEIIISKEGKIDVINNVYYNASKGLDDMKSFYVSKLNYKNNYLVEIVPDINYIGIDNKSYFIADSIYYDLGEPSNIGKIDIYSLTKKQKGKHISSKSNGIIFTNKIPNYDLRNDIKDTILFDKEFKRFEIETEESYSRYYIYKTDTLMPYSISRIVEKDYKGRIERIDTYDKVNDVFLSIQLIPSKDLDPKAKKFFEYMKFLRNSKENQTKN